MKICVCLLTVVCVELYTPVKNTVCEQPALRIFRFLHFHSVFFIIHILYLQHGGVLWQGCRWHYFISYIMSHSCLSKWVILFCECLHCNILQPNDSIVVYTVKSDQVITKNFDAGQDPSPPTRTWFAAWYQRQGTCSPRKTTANQISTCTQRQLESSDQIGFLDDERKSGWLKKSCNTGMQSGCVCTDCSNLSNWLSGRIRVSLQWSRHWRRGWFYLYSQYLYSIVFFGHLCTMFI